jgi:uncharacterized protein YkwD
MVLVIMGAITVVIAFDSARLLAKRASGRTDAVAAADAAPPAPVGAISAISGPPEHVTAAGSVAGTAAEAPAVAMRGDASAPVGPGGVTGPVTALSDQRSATPSLFPVPVVSANDPPLAIGDGSHDSSSPSSTTTTTAAPVPYGTPAAVAPGAASRALELLQQYRLSKGLTTLRVVADATRKAEAHAREMADAGFVWHTPLGSGLEGSWMACGENVGFGYSVDRIHAEFIDSPTHEANMASTSFTAVGIGVAYDANGVVYIAQEFVG